jgi:O-antigen/teichoic acid export membrane protein
VAGSEGLADRTPSSSEHRSDQIKILSGTGINLFGLVVFVVATYATNVLISRVLGAPALALVTLATQLAFIGGAATRFGMDMAAVRRVAVDVGRGEPGRVRAVMDRAVLVAAAVSVPVGIAIALVAEPLAKAFNVETLPAAANAFVWAGVALPFVALCQVYLGGTRGLKLMRHTLIVYWAGQPTAWIALIGIGWVMVVRDSGVAVAAYALSWIGATVASWWVWRRETAAFDPLPAEAGETRALVRYGAPRAPAALLSQLLFWADYFVLSLYATPAETGVYAAAVRVAQALVLFLIAVNYMFSPFVADLHARGERERLDGLYKALTRWVLAGTIPLVLVLLVVPGPVLQVFGAEFAEGSTALRILLIGQFVNVAVGSVGFILIMVGRTGWDLAVYAASFAIDVGLALALAPVFGANGAATAQATALVVANVARLWLVWRFVGIQPFTRWYARLAIPGVASAVVMIVTHLALRGSAWPVDLLGTAVLGTVAYLVVLWPTALKPSERAALGLLVRAARS